jgi:hypothetical protein
MFASRLTQLFYEVSDEALETAAGIEIGGSLLPWQTGPNGALSRHSRHAGECPLFGGKADHEVKDFYFRF